MDSPPEIKHGVHRIHREPWWSEDSPTQLLSWQRIHLQRRRPQVDFWVRKICCRRDRLPTPVFSGFLCGSAGKESPTIWETWVQSLSWEDLLEKGKATHSSILAWRILWTIQSMRLQVWILLSDFHYHFSKYHQCKHVKKLSKARRKPTERIRKTNNS